MKHYCYDCESIDNIEFYPKFQKWLCPDCADEYRIAQENDLFDKRHGLDIID